MYINKHMYQEEERGFGPWFFDPQAISWLFIVLKGPLD